MKTKRSIKTQWTIIFIALMSACILLSIFGANALLRHQYHKKQVDDIKEEYDNIRDLKLPKPYSVIGWRDTELRSRLTKASQLGNMIICIFYVDRTGAINSMYASGSDRDMERMYDSLISYVFDGKDETADKCKIIKNGVSYKIFETDDSYFDSKNYDLIGKLDNDYYCFLRMNYESGEESAKIASGFYLYLGIIIMLLEAVIVIFALKRFARPIENMNVVAKRMTDLDFEAKAEVKSNDEIGQLAESLNTLSETLEKKIVELKEANAKLQIDLDKRVQIDEMRREFLGNVSHELKTPIAIIEGYAEGLRDNVNEDAESRDYYCDVIIDEAAKMSDLVKRMLALNKIEYGENQLDIERFDITEVISGVLKASEVLAGGREIEVACAVKSPTYVYADQFMTEEVISNFVSNAYHYVGGENRIEVTLLEVENRVRLSVFNTGSSIPEDELDKVWIKFYKVDKARTREYGGTGIGLSIVKAIAELHNTDCGVLNRDGGVEFWFEFDGKAE